MATTVYENPRVRVMVLFDGSIKVIINRRGEFETNPNKRLGENIHTVNEFLCEQARSYNRTAVLLERRGDKKLAAAARAAANSCVQAADNWSDALHRALNKSGIRWNVNADCFADEYMAREAAIAWRVLGWLKY